MLRLVTLSIVVSFIACGEKESPPRAASTGSASAPAPAPPEQKKPSAEPAAEAPPSESDADEVAQLVVKDVASKALGSQTIEASCVSVAVVPVGKWKVATARLKDCGDKTARSILWLYKRSDNAKWSEDYVGQPPRCWKGVPPDIAEAVSKLTSIPSC